jgi:hypothetical protein
MVQKRVTLTGQVVEGIDVGGVVMPQAFLAYHQKTLQ